MKFLRNTDTFSVASRDSSAELRGRLERELPDDIVLSVVTVGEIEFGTAKRMPAPRIAARIAELCQSFRILTLDEGAAAAYGGLRQHLRSQVLHFILLPGVLPSGSKAGSHGKAHDVNAAPAARSAGSALPRPRGERPVFCWLTH